MYCLLTIACKREIQHHIFLIVLLLAIRFEKIIGFSSKFNCAGRIGSDDRFKNRNNTTVIYIVSESFNRRIAVFFCSNGECFLYL